MQHSHRRGVQILRCYIPSREKKVTMTVITEVPTMP